MTFLIQEENPPEYEPEDDIGIIMKLAVIDCVYERLFKKEKHEENTINSK